MLSLIVRLSHDTALISFYVSRKEKSSAKNRTTRRAAISPAERASRPRVRRNSVSHPCSDDPRAHHAAFAAEFGAPNVGRWPHRPGRSRPLRTLRIRHSSNTVGVRPHDCFCNALFK
jgi:hypothetical protein